MSKLITVKAYQYQELNDDAKNKFMDMMYDMPFDYEDKDEEGNTIIKYDYFAEWDLQEQIDFCEINEYLFDKYGNLIGHLAEV
tara:strand:+ start:189 stop:437 length:249 start_codon:yes stop_codon:yes gene_type:complete